MQEFAGLRRGRGAFDCAQGRAVTSVEDQKQSQNLDGQECPSHSGKTSIHVSIRRGRASSGFTEAAPQSFSLNVESRHDSEEWGAVSVGDSAF